MEQTRAEAPEFGQMRCFGVPRAGIQVICLQKRHFCAQKFQNRPKCATFVPRSFRIAQKLPKCTSRPCRGHVAAMSRPRRGHVAATSRPCRGHVAAMSRPYLGIFRENEAVLGCDVHFGQVFSSIAPVSADFGEKNRFSERSRREIRISEPI